MCIKDGEVPPAVKEDARLSVAPRFKIPFLAKYLGLTPAVNESAVGSNLNPLSWLLWDPPSSLATNISKRGAFSALDMNTGRTWTWTAQVS